MSSHLSIAGIFNRLNVIVIRVEEKRSTRVSGCEKDNNLQEAREDKGRM